MPVQLNHTIVRAHDKHETARHLVEILSLPDPTVTGPFLEVRVTNDVSLDVADELGPPDPQHYAFLVTEEEFDAIHQRLLARGIPYWADPMHHQPNEVNHEDGGRALYWDDPNGHVLEIITVPYGGWG
jgi:catechol 2,3-dioxygenase-like lactoylglutathione lyase family enzyme